MVRRLTPNRVRARGKKFLTITGFLALLPGVRPELARRQIAQWDIIGSEIDDVYPIANVFFGEGYHYLLGSKAAQKILDAYHAGVLPMKNRKQPVRAAHAQDYVNADHRLPPYYDPALRLTRNEQGQFVLMRFSDELPFSE